MSRNGSGTYSLPEAPFVYDTVISETAVNSNFSDIASAITQSLSKDGQTTPTASLPMGTYKHTGVGNGTARDHYAAVGQVQDDGVVWCGTAGGTINALTLTPAPAITAYATGQRFRFQAGSSPSDDAVTIAISGLTAKAAEINDAPFSSTVVIEANKYYETFYDGTALQVTRLSVNALSSSDIGSTVQGYDADTLKADVTATLSAGFNSDVHAIGNSGTGTVTLTATTGEENLKTLTITGSFTLAPQATNTVVALIATNDGTGGYTITTSGYSLVSGTYNSTASAVHLMRSTVIGSVKVLEILEIA